MDKFEGAQELNTIDKVVFAYEVVEQAIRNHVSNMLMDTDEQHPRDVGVYVYPDPQSFDTMEFDKAYMMPGDGRIYFHEQDYSSIDEGWHDFSLFTLGDQLFILKQMYGV